MKLLLTIILVFTFTIPVFADGVNVRRKKKRRPRKPKVVKVYKQWKDRSLLRTDMELALYVYQRPLSPLLDVPVFAGEIADTYVPYTEEFVTPAAQDSDSKWALWLIPIGGVAALIPVLTSGHDNVPVGITPFSITPNVITPTVAPTPTHPVPEPATLLLLGSGLVILAKRRSTK